MHMTWMRNFARDLGQYESIVAGKGKVPDALNSRVLQAMAAATMLRD